MSPELIGIISVGAGLAVLFVGLLAWLRQDMKEQGREITELRKVIEGVKIEVAPLRATVETYFRVRVDSPWTAAVAESPEDYSVD